MHRVSVILTVLDEASSLPRLLDTLAGQTRLPDEVIVCDGGSTDGTRQLLEDEGRLPLQVIHHPGANISQGRNLAIEAAGGDVIAVTDAGVRLDPRWLEAITAPFDDPAVQAVAGGFVSAPETLFETAMGATVLPEMDEIDPAAFLPSSRSVAFRKRVWEAVGGYPEWLDYCEDLILDIRMRQRFGPFVFVPQALVYFRPRSSLRAFWKQYWRYARGDGKANLWFERHLVRYGTYLLAMPLILIAGLFHSRWSWALYLIAIPGMFWAGWRRLVRTGRSLTVGQRLGAVLLVPVIRVTGDLAKMGGYPVGVCWRWRNRERIPDWRRP